MGQAILFFVFKRTCVFSLWFSNKQREAAVVEFRDGCKLVEKFRSGKSKPSFSVEFIP